MESAFDSAVPLLRIKQEKDGNLKKITKNEWNRQQSDQVTLGEI